MDETTNTQSRGSGSIESEGARAPAPVTHPTPKERAAKGEGGSGEGSSREPRGLGSAGGPSGPRRPARGAGDVAGARARPDPVRPDAGLAVRLLPGRGRGHGRRPRGDAALRAHRPGLRRRAPVELRRVRLARAAAAVRHQRLRRDAARVRGNGTSSVWRRASRSPAANNGFTDKPSARRSRSAVAAYRTAMREFAAMGNLEVWYARARRCEELPRSSATLSSDKQAQRSAASGRSRRPGPRTACRPFAKLTRDGRRPAPDRQRPAADRARRRDARRRRAQTRCPRAVHGLIRALPAHAARRPPAPARGLPVRRRGPQGGRRRQRRHPRLDRPAARARRRRPAVPPGEGGEASVLEPFVGKSAYANHGQRVVDGAAADAGGERHLPRLGPRRGHRRRHARLLHPPAARLEGLGRVEDDEPRGDGASTARCAAGRSPGRTPGRATGSRSPHTSARRRLRPGDRASSPRRTRTRTSATTRRSSDAAGSGRLEAASRVCDIGGRPPRTQDARGVWTGGEGGGRERATRRLLRAPARRDAARVYA